MKTKNKLCQCPYNEAIQCDMSDPCSGCEDFTGELTTPKKEGFIVDEYYEAEDAIVQCTGKGSSNHLFSGRLIVNKLGRYKDDYDSTAWIKSVFEHLPNYKKQFKVGDWVEVVKVIIGDRDEIGRIAQVASVQTRDPKGVHLDISDVESFNDHFYYYSELKHTTKPKEQPLMFKQWDVDVREATVKIGCKTFDKNDLESALLVMNVVNEHTDVNAFRTWLDTNSAKLGL